MKITDYKRTLLSVCISALGTHSMFTVAAGVTATNPDQTKVLTTSNGAVLVNIAAPNRYGLSHNKYSDFNVSEAGLALNNRATGNRANTNLNGRAANIILNEVVSNNRSELNGRIGVIGQKAEFILANPNGISCNGCGFNNISNATLTTGIPEIDSRGRLKGFQLNDADIKIGSNGLNASGLNKLSIVSSKLDNKGSISNANELKVLLAKNARFDRSRESFSNVNSIRSGYLDTSNLGTMQANNIFIKAEGGLGVGIPDDESITTQEDLIIKAKTIVNGGNIDSRKIVIEAEQVLN